jgi:hypothetical protein
MPAWLRAGICFEPPPGTDAADVFRRLGPHSTEGEVETAASALHEELSSTDGADYLQAYRRLAADVAGGKIPGETVAECLDRARGPRVRNRGRAFNSALKRCRAGKPPPTRRVAPRGPEPDGGPPPRQSGIPWALESKPTVVSSAVRKIQARAEGGMADGENRVLTDRNAEITCRRYGLTGDDRARYLAWVGEALGHVLDGQPFPSFEGSAVADIGRMPKRAAV